MNLTYIAKLTKKIVTAFALLTAMYILSLIFRPVLKNAFYAVFPPKDLPNPVFGKLDPLVFNEIETTNSNYNFSINTADGELPSGFPKNMIVYEIKTPEFSFQAGKDAQEIANYLGFGQNDLVTDLKGSIYRWRNRTSGGFLEIDINTKEISLKTDLSTKSNVYPIGSVTTSSASAASKQMAVAIGGLTAKGYQNAEMKVNLARISGTSVRAAPSSSAQLARVDFFRKFGEYPVLGENPYTGLISVLYGNSSIKNNAYNFPYVKYIERDVVENTNNVATYPIITINEAWNAVTKDDKGVIVSVLPIGGSVFDNPNNVSIEQVFIDKIYLAYYETDKNNKYIQPIYVFEGKYNVDNRPGGTLTIYFPAIQGQYINPVDEDQQNSPQAQEVNTSEPTVNPSISN